MALKTALINVMEQAARKAARPMLRDLGEVEQLQVSRKGPADFVSAVDHKAEKILVAELGRARPKFGFLAEERGEVPGEDPNQRWIIDPLDGTTNFLHGIPHFAVSIALEHNGEIIAGVIYDPIKDECFWAEKGIGAFLNERRLRVSARGELRDTIFATGIPFLGREGHGEFHAILRQITDKVAGIRRFGSAALDLAYVAAGRYDGFWESELNIWDIAAGIIIVREAGGFVTDFSGAEARLANGEIVAANANLHRPLMQMIAAGQRENTEDTP